METFGRLINLRHLFSALARLNQLSQNHRYSARDGCTGQGHQPALTNLLPAHTPNPSSTRSAELFSCCANKTNRRLFDNKWRSLLTSSRDSWQLSQRGHCACAVHREFPYLSQSSLKVKALFLFINLPLSIRLWLSLAASFGEIFDFNNLFSHDSELWLFTAATESALKEMTKTEEKIIR